MAQCELLATCIFFNDKMADYPAAAEHLKKKMCLADPDTCARMMIVKAWDDPTSRRTSSRTTTPARKRSSPKRKAH